MASQLTTTALQLSVTRMWILVVASDMHDRDPLTSLARPGELRAFRALL